MRKLKLIPKFKSEDEEREFWRTHDTTDYINWSDAKMPVMRRKGIPKVGDLAIYWSTAEEEERAGNVIEIAGVGDDTVLTVENTGGGGQELVSSRELIHFLPSRLH